VFFLLSLTFACCPSYTRSH